jgi:bacterioferritin-associated ferredoxin
MIVCHCRAVTDRDIRKAVRSGARTRNQVVEVCAANMDCGGCAPVIDAIIEAEIERDAARSFTPFAELAVIS